MFTDSPNVRKVIYVITIVLAGTAIVLKHINSPWAASAADAVSELVTYVAGLAGLVAAGHVNTLPIGSVPMEKVVAFQPDPVHAPTIVLPGAASADEASDEAILTAAGSEPVS